METNVKILKDRLNNLLENKLSSFNIQRRHLESKDLIELGNELINKHRETLINVIDRLTPNDYFTPKKLGDEILFKTLLKSMVINNNISIYSFERDVNIALLEKLQELNGNLIRGIDYNFENMYDAFTAFHSSKDIYKKFMYNLKIIKRNYDFYVNFEEIKFYFLHPYSVYMTLSFTRKLYPKSYNSIMIEVDDLIKELALNNLGVIITDEDIKEYNNEIINGNILNIPKIVTSKEDNDSGYLSFSMDKEYYTDEVICDIVNRHGKEILDLYFNKITKENQNKFLFSLFKSIVNNRIYLKPLTNKSDTSVYDTYTLTHLLKQNKVQAGNLVDVEGLLNENNLTVETITLLLVNNPNIAKYLFKLASKEVLIKLFKERPGFISYASKDILEELTNSISQETTNDEITY